MADRNGTIDATMIYGKVPPQAKDLERATLGTLLMEPASIDRVANLLQPEMFYVTEHQVIYSSILRIYQRNQSVDMLLVREDLIKHEQLETIGGAYALVKLTNEYSSSVNLENYARIIVQKFLQRELIRIGGEIVSEAYADTTDVFDLLDQSEQNLLAIGSKNVHGEVKKIDSVMMRTVQRIEEWRRSETHVTGVPTGFNSLDRATRGWQNGDLIILAARPSVGKTAFAIQLIRNAVFNNIKRVPVACWSLEMDDVQLVLRALSAESGVMLHKIQTGRITDQEMEQIYKKGIQRLAQSEIFIDDEPGLNIYRLRSKARRLVKKYKVGLIIVDYLQLMSGDDRNREREVASISRGLKLLAKELRIPIIALSQLSRDLEKRTGSKRIPQLSDLRESGAIEQDADVVLFLWGPEEDEIEQDADLLNRRYARIAKQRNGMLLTTEFEFDRDIQEWKEFNSGPRLVPISMEGPRMPFKESDNPF
jgi:replicative DNA helicase